MPIDLPYLSEIDEFLKSEFPKDWLKNFRINETSAALVADISEKEISFSSKMTLAEKKLFKSFNHLILSGEYIYKEEALAKLQEIETTFNEIQAPQPSIVKIKDDEVRKKIDSYNDSISNSFINLFFNPIKHALTNVKSFVDHINDYSAYNNSEILFTFKLKSNIDNLDEDAEIYRDVLFININVATFDHMIAVDDYTLEHLIKANHTLLDNKYNSIKTESYYSLLVEKISFLIRKIIFRKEKEALKGETPLSKQIYYLDGEKRVIRPDDFKLSHNKSTEWESRFKNHYGDDHHYFISSEEIEKIKEKIITGKFREISIDDLHKAVKFFKDREKSTTFLEKIRIEYDKFYYEELKKTKCEFDKISLKINRNYIYNNEFSLFVDQNTDWHKIEDKLEKVVNIQEETSINNFFPFLKTVKWLSNHIEAELKEINLETIPLNLKRVEDLVSAYKKYVDKWEKNLKWCHLRDYLAFRLFKKDSTTPISLVNDIGEKAYDLFIASSFILPFNYDRKKRQLKEYKEKETQFISELVFYKTTLKTVTDINKINDDVKIQKAEIRNQERKVVEILGVFTAIVLFTTESVQLFQKVGNFGDALMFLGVFSAALVMFAILIRIVIRPSINYDGKIINDIPFYKDGSFIVSLTVLFITILASGIVYHSSKSPKVIEKSKCHTSSYLPLKKATITPEDLNELYSYENSFATNDTLNPPKNHAWFEFKSGNSKILILAPHATSQMREGKRKIADGGTGSLALYLNKNADIPILYTCYKSPTDPNYYDNEFKDTLSKIIKLLKPDFVIDLHGSSSSRPYDIDFGTMGNISYLNKKDVFLNMIKIFKENGLTILSQDCLAASKNQTDTKWLHHLGVPCVQLEINSNYLMRPQYDTSGIGPIYKQKGSQVLQALMEFTKDFN